MGKLACPKHYKQKIHDGINRVKCLPNIAGCSFIEVFTIRNRVWSRPSTTLQCGTEIYSPAMKAFLNFRCPILSTPSMGLALRYLRNGDTVGRACMLRGDPLYSWLLGQSGPKMLFLKAGNFCLNGMVSKEKNFSSKYKLLTIYICMYVCIWLNMLSNRAQGHQYSRYIYILNSALTQ